MKRRNILSLVLCGFLLLSLTIPGAYALWVYLLPPEPVEEDVATAMRDFKYGLLYITDVKVTGGAYSAAAVTKTDDVDISANLTLTNNAASSVTVDITIYNSTEVSYYFNEAQTVAWDNDRIQFAVSGIAQKDEIPSKTYKTIQVIFAYAGNDTSRAALSAGLHFNFVVDKDSIGTIVAQTAVDRFLDILNDPTIYQELENDMNERSGWNQASAVTYIGNVAGSDAGDSADVNELFGEGFMSMDLDGDGKAEPITMMIKREDLDGNEQTGDSYTYIEEGWLGNQTEHHVYGVEMTIYITAQDPSSASEVVVYAATFTKEPNASEWIQIVPLTPGKADTNNYNGWGTANSFDTDTWESDDGKTMRQLVAENFG